MDTSAVRNDFPTIRKDKGVYLDNACQTLRPDSVIKSMNEYYEEYPSCGGRSLHGMSTQVSIIIDDTREKLASFFGTDDPNCYAFTKNCTEGLNTIAFGYGLKKEDTILTTDSEHNSNHVPWLHVSNNIGTKRKFTKSTTDGEFDIEDFKSCMGKDVKVVSVFHVNNVTGYVNPVKDIIDIAHDYGATVILDGSQATPHMKVDFKDLDVDFYCTSIHKMLGPSGVGILYGKSEYLDKLKPLTVGGGAVGTVSNNHADYAAYPDKFEAGLQNYSGIAGTKAALEYLEKIGMDKISKHDKDLMKIIFNDLEDMKGLEIIGSKDPEKRSSIFSFNVNGIGAHDIAMIIDKMDNIMIRSGTHCSISPHNVSGSARASVYFYNDINEINRFTTALKKLAETFRKY